MARAANASSTSVADAEVLESIALSVRGSFQTVEDMTQSFIREAIMQGVFPPGQRLNLDSIAALLGVSRMPVRASLRQLESEGLLTISAYRGATVSVLQPKEIAEIYELRIMLELYLLERAMENLDDALLNELQVIVGELETAEELGVRLERRRCFYETLYARADRPRALAEVNRLRGAVGRYLLLQRVDVHPVHDEFVTYLAERNLAKARAWLAAHLERVSARLQEVVAGESTGPDRAGT